MTVQEIADIIRFAAEYTPYWTDDPATHQCPYENAAKALLTAGYGKLVDEYEYAVLRTILSGELGKPMIVGDCWSSREEVNEGLVDLSTDRVNYKLVKRRKAGGIENV